MKKIVLQIVFLFQIVVLVATPNWEVNSSNYEFSMTITGTFNEESEIEVGENDLLGAFFGEECRGVVEVVYEADYGAYYFYLTVFSNQYENEKITFKFYNASEDKTYNNLDTVIFSNGKSIGTLANPFDFSGTEIGTGLFEQYSAFDLCIYPNPVINELYFALPESNLTTINVITMQGQLVEQLAKFDNKVNVSHLKQGVYLLEIVTDKIVATQKFIKK